MRKSLLIAVMFVVLASQLVLSADTTLSVDYVIADESIRPGSETTITFTLTNPSSSVDITSIKAYFSGGSDLEISPTQITLGGLDATRTKDVAIVVKAKSGTGISNLNARFTYYAPTQKIANVNVPMEVKQLPTIQVLGTEYDRVPGPGSAIKLNLTLKNNGDGSADDIQVELGESDAFVAETNDAYVDSLIAHGVVDVPFEITIDPETEIGVYNIPITITYLDSRGGTSYTIEKNFGLKVSGVSEFIFTVDSQGVITPGGSGVVNVKIANSGTAPINYLSAGFGDDLVYIGTIDSDDYELGEFVLSPSDIGWGVQEVQFRMKYKDSFDNQYDENYPVTVHITDPFTNIFMGFIGLIASLVIPVVGIVIIYFIYKRFFHKKKEHPHHNQHEHTTHKVKRKRRR